MQLSHEFYVVGPAFAPQPRRMRFSPAVTTHLSAGHDQVPAPPTPAKVRALLGRLNRIAAEAEPEAARSKAPGAAKAAIAPDPQALRQAESRGYERGRKAGEAAAWALYAAEFTRFSEAFDHFRECVHRADGPPVLVLDPFNLAGAAAEVGPLEAHGVDSATEVAQLADALIREAPPIGKPEKRRAPAAAAPTAGATQLLATAVSHWPVLFSWSQLAALNERKARGGHFNTCRKLLIDGGLVAERDGKVEPADAAFEKLGMARKKRPGTRAEVLAMWLAALPSPAKDILREVAGGVRHHGRGRSRTPPEPGPSRRALEYRRQYVAEQ